MYKSILTLLFILLFNQAFSDFYTISNQTAIDYFIDAQTEINLNADYDKGLEFIKKALEEEPEFLEALYALRETYEYLSDYSNIVNTCKRIEKNQFVDDMMLRVNSIKLGAALYSAGRYEESREEFDHLLDSNSTDIEYITQMIKKIDYALDLKLKGYDIEFQKLKRINSPSYNELNPCLIIGEQTLVFTKRTIQFHRDATNNIFFSNLTNGVWTFPAPISDNVNSESDDGYPSLTSNGKGMYFSSSNEIGLNYGDDDIYYSEKKVKSWSEPENLGIEVNGDDWEAHPCVSSDGSLLFFASNREGGEGGTDLWMSRKSGDGEWGNPVNLGPGVNTSKDEIAPHIHYTGRYLYFSSNGRKGMGGFDVFVSELLPSGKWGEARNLGYPINQGGDQFKLFVTADGQMAYQSRKEEDETSFDIYKFELPEELKPKLELHELLNVKRIAMMFDSINRMSFANSINSIVNPNAVLSLELIDTITQKEVKDAICTFKLGDKVFAKGNISQINLDSNYTYHVKIERTGYDVVSIEGLKLSGDKKITRELIRNSEFKEDAPNLVAKELELATTNNLAIANNEEVAKLKAELEVVKKEKEKVVYKVDTVFVDDKKQPIPPRIIKEVDTVFVDKSNQVIVPKVIKKVDTVFVNKGVQLPSDTNFPIFELYYGRNHHLVSDENSEIYQKLLAELKKNRTTKCLIKSYSDGTGNKYYNFILSYKRAKYLKKQLIKDGIEIGRINTSHFGENFKYEDESKNRRSEIIIY
jgi:outer membrane protein OmpA-like peptidoglycan-associated protein